MINSGITTYIFDLDGVIIDSFDDLYASAVFMLETLGLPVRTKEEIRALIGMGNRNLVAGATGLSDKDHLEKAISVFMQHYAENCIRETRLREGVLPMLKGLAGKNLSILSNKFASLTNIILSGLGVIDSFPIILGPEQLDRMKPDPEGVYKILSFFGSSKRETIIVGDSDSDIFTGKNAGIVTCGVLGGIGDEAKLRASDPDVLINTPDELLCI